MMRPVQSRRAAGSDAGFLVACCLVYFAAYLTRGNFSAALVAIIGDLGITKKQVSFAVAGSFITYGAGQLISGYLGDRFAPGRLVAAGLAATALNSLLLPLTRNIALINLLWCINGFCQALIWPSLVRMMTARLGSAGYANSSGLVMTSASAATILLYLLVPACIVLADWRLAFFICGAAALAVVPFWCVAARGICAGGGARVADLPRDTDESLFRLLRRSGLLPVLLAIIAQGALRDGVTTWMPSYLSESCGISAASSILSTVLLPVMGIAGVAAAALLAKKCRSELLVSGLLFGASFLASLLLAVCGAGRAAVSVGLMAGSAAAIHGVNLMLTGYLPAHFASSGHVSLIAGLLNMFTYVGSALSVYGIAAVAEGGGWQTTLLLLAGLALFGMLICLLQSRRWNTVQRECGAPEKGGFGQ